MFPSVFVIGNEKGRLASEGNKAERFNQKEDDPANQAGVNNNAWAKYSAQLRQGSNVSSGTSGPTLQQNGRR
jgi:hypothetical protein